MSLDFYRLRADEARRAAAQATLANVRERHLGAAAAWDAMAGRAAQIDRGRAENDARKAAAAETAALEAAEEEKALPGRQSREHRFWGP